MLIGTSCIAPGVSGKGGLFALVCAAEGKRDRGAIVFVRHKSGPVYYWYEALSTKYLKIANDCEAMDKKLCVEDIVVDDHDELLWRLHALYAVANFKGTRIVALGGAMGKYAGDARVA